MRELASPHSISGDECSFRAERPTVAKVGLDDWRNSEDTSGLLRGAGAGSEVRRIMGGLPVQAPIGI